MRRFFQRQSLLFLGAVIVPSVFLIALGIRAMRQEEELAEKRANEEKQRAITLVRQELSNRLQGIKLRVAAGKISPRDDEVALHGTLISGRLVLPWETTIDQRPPTAAFSTALQTGEESLHRLHDSAGAAAYFREAGRLASDPAEGARADLLLAASLHRKGDRIGGYLIERRLLKLVPRVADEYGVPFALYAARRLVESPSTEDREEASTSMEQLLDAAWLSPVAIQMVLETLRLLHVSSTDPLYMQAGTRAEELEQAGHLGAEISAVALSGDSHWAVLGKRPWFVGTVTPPDGQNRQLLAVRVRALVNSIKLPECFRWSLDGATGGESLGGSFPEIRLAITPAQASPYSHSREYFYFSALTLVVLLTVVSAYLLGRDVRREARMTGLRSQFVASVSHELKTPITAIRASAELMALGRVRDEKANSEYLTTIIGESERLSRLVDGVLDFSRVEQGKRPYRFLPVEVGDIVQAAVRALNYQFVQGGFAVRVAVGAVPRVKGDRLALEQAVTNLLSNAIKYSPDHREIDISVNRTDGQIVIRVQDRGIGIAPDQQGLIFERFYRAPMPETHNVPGAGVGLTLVNHIVQAHGGSVSLESQPGQGSVFSILLPIAEGA